MTKVFAVRIGDKYGPEYEDYINSLIPNVTWIRQPIRHDVQLQWNKLYPMALDLDEPVVVIDIDMVFMNAYMDLIEYPIERGQFVAMHNWWATGGCPLQGGFQKYYPKDCRYIYDKFMRDPSYWQWHYIKKKETSGLVNGEQNFVYESVLERLELKYVPDQWCTKWKADPQKEWVVNMNANYPGDWLYLGEEFNPEVRVLHFLGRERVPPELLRPEWEWQLPV